MKPLLLQYAAYNIWANKILLEKLASVPNEVLFKDMGSSFPGIYQTLAHLLDADRIWWQRLHLQENIQRPSEALGDDFEDVSRQLIHASKQWHDWVNEADEKKLGHVFAFYNSKREYFKQPVHEMLMHLFNHQTYHRGQVVTMLRQQKVDKVPATDFIAFCRKAK